MADLKALIFDFDGVIIDTETQWYEIFRDWLRDSYGYDLDIEDYLVCVGADTHELFAFLRREVGDRIDPEGFQARAQEEFIRRSERLPVLPGVEELIGEAHAAGIKIALATSATKDKPVFHLKRLGLLDSFDALSTAELSERIKPYPDIFLKAAELVGVQPKECLAIEDSENGLLAAKRAGMACLAVPSPVTRGCAFHGADGIVPSLDGFTVARAREVLRRASER